MLNDLDAPMTRLRAETNHALLKVLRWTDAASYHARELQTLVERRLTWLTAPDWLSSRHSDLAVRILIGYGLLSLLVAVFCPRAPPKQLHQPSISPLTALLRLFVPRTSIWPPILISVTNDAKRRARETGKHVIYLPLDKVLGLMEDGSLSLRNPERDARLLVKGMAHIGGWGIEFVICFGRWQWTYAFWWLRTNFKAVLSPLVVSSIVHSCQVLILH